MDWVFAFILYTRMCMILERLMSRIIEKYIKEELTAEESYFGNYLTAG